MINDSAKRVLYIEAEAVRALAERVDERFARAVALMQQCLGRVVVSGMGKSGLVARKIAATLSSTGTPALFLHPAEARHGDLGMLAAGDVVLALSYSGDTEELLALIGPIKRLGIALIAMTGIVASPLAAAADAVLDVSVAEEACALGLAPTASTTAALAMGDALAMALAEAKGFSAQQFAALHPGGQLGKRLTPIGQLMHTGAALPVVAPEARLHEVVYEMSRKGFGVTSVLGPGRRLAGIISDGDLRRLLEQHDRQGLDLPAEAYMTRDPVTIGAAELAPVALQVMEARKITVLLVVDEQRQLLGLVHLHDLWKTQLV